MDDPTNLEAKMNFCMQQVNTLFNDLAWQIFELVRTLN